LCGSLLLGFGSIIRQLAEIIEQNESNDKEAITGVNRKNY